MSKQPQRHGPVAVRRMQPDDHEALHEIYSQPGVIRGTLQLPHPSAQLWRERAAATDRNAHWLVAVLDGRVVGHLGLFTVTNPRRAHVGHIAMAVHDDWQGRGIGTVLMEAALDLADRWLNLRRVELEVFTDNEPAVRLYRRMGFETEGTRKAFAFRDGEFADVYVMGRLRASHAPAGADG